jgi:hypothetical protein
MLIVDIDGIKIKSDVEGGANKRSYNYRVHFVGIFRNPFLDM